MSTAITADRLAEITAQLNGYEAAHPHAMSSDIWQDVILNLPEYDESKTTADDTGNDIAVLTDGSMIYYDCPGRKWAVGRIGVQP